LSWVLDASAALAWAFDRADSKERRQAAELLDRLSTEEAIVPELWHLETVNALLVAQRRNVITAERCHDFLGRLSALPIRTHTAPPDVKSRLLSLAGQFGLTAYDAAYLDLALRTGSDLATFDRRLAEAREKAGVASA
jgi:predicted nucleic acid-binding protein